MAYVPLEDAQASTARRRRRGALALGALAATAGAAVRVARRPLFQALAAETDATLGFSCSNEYSSAASPGPGVGYLHLDPRYTVEPARLTTLEALSSPHAPTSCGWEVALEMGAASDVYDDEAASRSFTANGTTVAVVFPRPGTYAVTVSCLNGAAAGKHKTLSATKKVTCTYVRRELRELSDADRDAFLDAFMVMASTGSGAGQRLYGQHYRALSEFESMHLVAAGGARVDHIHDGLGMPTQHIAMSAEFELSLQSVAKQISLPNWDYTVDSYLVKAAKNGDKTQAIFSSDLFSDDWFGATSGQRHTVTSGRFGYLEVPLNASAEMHSPFGYLRAPWNVNPSPFVTRYHNLCGMDLTAAATGGGSNGIVDYTWPTCAIHHKMTFSDLYSSWYKWSWNIGYTPHGPVHAWIGGVGGDCESAFDGLAPIVGDAAVMGLKAGSFGLLKDAYRSKIFLNTYGVDVSSLVWKDQLEVVETVFCETTYWPGDHLEAASPIEAPFWPIHPTIERLLHYKALALPFKEHLWEDISAGPGKSLYCTEDMTECRGHPLGPHALAGHREERHRRLRRPTTNEEVRQLTSPNENYSLPYIYNHFEWPHCDEDGYPFRKLESPALSSSS
ncbi:hypothetical protein JL721_6593 [Aureococcus anophagefferens]|nr:hypothetical protein JL721_6593 [Aureococcus anophagefferens]